MMSDFPEDLQDAFEKEKNFDDKAFLDYLNSSECKEKIDKATEKILNTKFETGE
jgi:hypothetical protein